MASNDAYEEVKTWLSDNWGGTYPILDFDYADEAYTQGEAPFIVLEENMATEQMVAIAGIRPTVDETAPFSVHLFFPSGTGREAMRTLGQQIMTKGRQLDLEYGRIWRVHPPNPGLINDGLWHSMVVELDYVFTRRPTIEREVEIPDGSIRQ